MPGLFRRPPQPIQRRRVLVPTSPATQTGYPGVVLADSPLAYYRLGEPSGTTMTDEVGAHSGTYAGSVALGDEGIVGGDGNTALGLAGLTSTYGKVAGWTTVPNKPITLECWAKWNGDTGVGDTSLGGWFHQSGVMACQLYVNGVGGAAGTVNLRIGTEQGNANADCDMSDLGWHHVVGTIDSGGNARLYFDGALVAGPTAVTFSGGTSDNPFKIGTYGADGAKQSWEGDLDEWAVYSTALSATQVAEHYAIGSSLFAQAVLDDDPSGYWRLGEASGNALDTSGNANNGTPTGTLTRNVTGGLTDGDDGAVTFGGGRFDVTDHATLDFGNVFSVEFWFKPSASGSYLLSKGNQFNVRYVSTHIALDNDDTGIAFETQTALNDGLWHHVVITHNGTGSGNTKIYIDGTSVTLTETAPDLSFSSNATALTIGSYGGGTAAYSGVLDEVAVYPTILSAARVTAHYEAAGTAGGGPITRTATDALARLDSVARQGVFLRAVSDTATRSDAASRVLSLPRTVTDSATWSDAATRIAAMVRTTTDTATRADSVGRQGAFGRAITDAATRSDAATRTGAFGRAATDALTWADSASQIKTLLRAATDAIARADVATRTVVLLRAVSDALTLSDAATRIMQAARSVTDTVTRSDAATQIKTLLRSVSDAITRSDAATRTGAFLRAVTDAATWSDSASRVLSAVRSVTDAITRSDAATQIKSLIRSVTDAVTLSDAATRSVSAVRSVTDAITHSDVATRAGVFLRAVTDAISWADTAFATKTGEVLAFAYDSITRSDVATRIGTFGRTATDAASRSDVATRIGVFARTVTDAVTRGDVATQLKTLLRAVSDSITRSDVATRTASMARAATDEVTRLDAATRALSFARSAVDAIVRSDVATRSMGFTRSAVDAVVRSDAATKSIGLLRTATDAVSRSDVASRAGAFARAAVDMITHSDVATRAVSGFGRSRGVTSARDFIATLRGRGSSGGRSSGTVSSRDRGSTSSR